MDRHYWCTSWTLCTQGVELLYEQDMIKNDKEYKILKSVTIIKQAICCCCLFTVWRLFLLCVRWRWTRLSWSRSLIIPTTRFSVTSGTQGSTSRPETAGSLRKCCSHPLDRDMINTNITSLMCSVFQQKLTWMKTNVFLHNFIFNTFNLLSSVATFLCSCFTLTCWLLPSFVCSYL